jgi:hypothetical protein
VRQSAPAAGHVLGGDPGADTEFSWQIAELAADFVLLAKAVDVVQPHAARVRFLERRHDAHQSRLATSETATSRIFQWNFDVALTAWTFTFLHALAL